MKNIIRVLLIEDSPIDARLIDKMLAGSDRTHFKVTPEGNLLSGLKALSEGDFDVVLLDLTLPDSSGVETLIKTLSCAPQVAVVVLTGLDHEELAVDAVRSGAQDYLVKGRIDPDLLSRAIVYAVERKRVEEALRESEEKYRHLVEDINDVIYATDANGAVTYISPSIKTMTGYEPSEIVGRHFTEFIHQEDLPRIAERFEAVLAGDPRPSEYRIITKSREIRWIRTSSRPMSNGKGVRGLRGVMTDITDAKRLQIQLQQAHKMEAIGRLAGGIAHDFNNLLSVVQGHVSLMLFDVDAVHPHFMNLKQIEEQVRSGSKLAAQLLGYARKGKYEVKPLNLNGLITETSEAFGRTKKQMSIYRTLGENLPTVEGDQGQLEQVLLNLYINAWQAMPEGGNLTLKTMNVTHRDIKGLPCSVSEGKYVLLAVTDTGVGMDEETRLQVFDPFFTTKEPGTGTGLGMASVYGIVKGHGGYIGVESEKGSGTTFSIYLPASKKRIPGTEKSSGPIVDGSGTILLVDDEKLVLGVATRLLNRLGYEVIQAGSGREALDIYNESSGNIDLVILDMIMPEMTGPQVFDKIRDIRPDARVLLSSGYSVEGEAQKLLQRGCRGFIQKPYGVAELAKKITEILEPSSPVSGVRSDTRANEGKPG